jgi:hypothetical protein
MKGQEGIGILTTDPCENTAIYVTAISKGYRLVVRNNHSMETTDQ